MKNILLTPALVAILGLALAGASFTVQAETSTTSPVVTSSKPAKVKPTSYSGSITAIDASSVTVASSKKTLTLAIAATTTYQKDGKTATLADFAVGDKVTGSYTKDAAGALTAYSLHKKTAKAAAPKSTSTTPAAPAAQ